MQTKNSKYSPVLIFGNRAGLLAASCGLKRYGAPRFPATEITYGKAWNAILAVLLLALLLLLSIPSRAAAQVRPSGQLMDAVAVAGDKRLICSFYLSRNKVSTYLSRVDGKKFLGKKIWSLRVVRARLKEMDQTIANLERSRDRAAPQQLEVARKDRKALAKARKQIERCSKGDDPSLVTFSHVKKILGDQCVNCHGVLGWENTEAFYLESGRVVPGDLESSSLYTFLGGNPEGFLPAYMPKGLPPISRLNTVLLSRWIRDLGTRMPAPTPTPGGPEGEGRALYQQNCAACHSGIDVSSKWGRTAAQIRAVLRGGSVPQMRHIRLSDDQINKIALALSRVQPPLEGTVSVRSLGPSLEGGVGATQKLQFELTLSGASSEPFTVGYVTSNGTALAGSDFEFASGTVAFEGRSGETRIVEVEIIGDSFEEGNESLFLDIGGISYGGVRVSTSTAESQILNDDVFTQVLPPSADTLRMAFGFNGDYLDAVTLTNATAQGDVTFLVPGRVGSGALALDVGPDYVTVPGQNLQSATDFTLGTWVYWQNPTSTTSRIIDFGSSTSNYLYFSPRDPTNRCRFELRSPLGVFTLQCNANVVLPSNAWVHVGLTFNATTDEMKIFFNGQQVAARSTVTAVLSAIMFSDNRIGRSRATGSTDFLGHVDDLMVWDKALDAAEINEVIAMSESVRISPVIEVRSGGADLPNGSTLDFGNVEIGETAHASVFITSRGMSPLALTGAPVEEVIKIVGRDAAEFSIEQQVWPWQLLLTNGSFSVFSVRYAPTSVGDKTATLIIENTDSRNGNFALRLGGQASGEAAQGPSEGDGGSDLETGQTLYSVNCSSCHGGIANSTKRDATFERVSAALNPVSGIPQMRGLGLNEQQINLVVLALNSPPPVSTEIATVENYVANVGTAPYVANVLTEVFLPEDPATYTANDLLIRAMITENILGLRSNGSFIAGRIVHFGGRCDTFEDVCQAEALPALQRPVPSTIRSGYLIRACDQILSNDGAVENVVAKIGRLSSSTVDPEATKQIYDLFFPGRELPQYLADVIANYTRRATGLSSRDHWRFQAHLFCTSGDWENL